MTHCDDYNALNAHPLYALVLSKFENRVGQIEQVGRDPNKSIPILNTAFSVLVYCTWNKEKHRISNKNIKMKRMNYSILGNSSLYRSI